MPSVQQCPSSCIIRRSNNTSHSPRSERRDTKPATLPQNLLSSTDEPFHSPTPLWIFPTCCRGSSGQPSISFSNQGSHSPWDPPLTTRLLPMILPNPPQGSSEGGQTMAFRCSRFAANRPAYIVGTQTSSLLLPLPVSPSSSPSPCLSLSLPLPLSPSSLFLLPLSLFLLSSTPPRHRNSLKSLNPKP